MLQRRFIPICALLLCAAACQKPAAVVTGETALAPSPSAQQQIAPTPEPTINPALQREAERLKFSEALQKDLNQALRLAAMDLVSAHLSFKELSKPKKDGPTPQQQAWLEKQAASFQPEALATLQQDYDAAAREFDLRGMTIASVVAGKIGKDAIKATPTIVEVQKQLLTGAISGRYIWSVSEATSSVVSGAYEEGIGSQRLTVQPKPGFQILRVKAVVKNISWNGDRPYTPWVWGDFKRAMSAIAPSQRETTGSSRWLDSEFIFLVVSGTEMILCGHVCEGSGLRETSMTISGPDGKGRMMTLPKAVKNGESVKVDVLFMMPQGKSDYRLLIFGAPPTALSR